LWHPFWLRIELVLVRRWRRRNYILYVLVFDVEKLLVGSLAGAAAAFAAAATLLQEARLRFWWLVIDRSIFFGLQKRLRLLDFYLCRSLESKKTEALLGFGSSSSAKRRTTRSKWKEEVRKQKEREGIAVGVV